MLGFENKALRKIFGAKRDEVTGEWKKLHNTELHALYPSPDIIRNIKSRRLRWAGHVARMGKSRNAYRVLVGRPEGKRPLGRPRCRWENDIKMDLREVGYDGRDWINLAQDRDQWRAYVRAAMNLWFVISIMDLAGGELALRTTPTWRTRDLFSGLPSPRSVAFSTADESDLPCLFGPREVFDFPPSTHIWEAFPYPPPRDTLSRDTDSPEKKSILEGMERRQLGEDLWRNRGEWYLANTRRAKKREKSDGIEEGRRNNRKVKKREKCCCQKKQEKSDGMDEE
ncbi:hypothetical protein ANN_26015 [Periplaneta americana]|uniref:Uncharacterized protein n=1 Tax=Periplaneta americana TaxID=6978 RepID=A0ABQ8S562_PERAM|nr:hypothetical protein ANN_26015 [Periplaneta americana]